MPGRDGSGPNGMGPMTGRAAGFCAGFAVPGFANPAAGRGFGFFRGGRPRGLGRGAGMGGGGGFGWRHRFYATGVPGFAWSGGFGQAAPDPSAEKTALENYVKSLETELEEVKKRLGSLESAGKA